MPDVRKEVDGVAKAHGETAQAPKEVGQLADADADGNEERNPPPGVLSEGSEGLAWYHDAGHEWNTRIEGEAISRLPCNAQRPCVPFDESDREDE